MMASPAPRRLLDAPSTNRIMLPNPSGTGVHHVPRSSKHRMPRTPLAVSREETEKTYQEEDEFEGLSKEEDWTVPGGAFESLSSNTKLGRAVQEACDELETLSGLERQTLADTQDMLRKLGYKGNILVADAPQQDGASPARIQTFLESAEIDSSQQN